MGCEIDNGYFPQAVLVYVVPVPVCSVPVHVVPKRSVIFVDPFSVGSHDLCTKCVTSGVQYPV